MVTVIDYAVRNDSEGEEFIVLVLQGDMNIIQSQSTGNFYATAYKTTISTTFNEVLAAKMVGKELPGEILKEECDPYEYTNPETGEVSMLIHTYRYVEQAQAVAQGVPAELSKEIGAEVGTFSKNGHMAMA